MICAWLIVGTLLSSSSPLKQSNRLRLSSTVRAEGRMPMDSSFPMWGRACSIVQWHIESISEDVLAFYHKSKVLVNGGRTPSTFHPCSSQTLLSSIRDARYSQGQTVNYLKPSTVLLCRILG